MIFPATFHPRTTARAVWYASENITKLFYQPRGCSAISFASVPAETGDREGSLSIAREPTRNFKGLLSRVIGYILWGYPDTYPRLYWDTRVYTPSTGKSSTNRFRVPQSMYWGIRLPTEYWQELNNQVWYMSTYPSIYYGGTRLPTRVLVRAKQPSLVPGNPRVGTLPNIPLQNWAFRVAKNGGKAASQAGYAKSCSLKHSTPPARGAHITIHRTSCLQIS